MADEINLTVNLEQERGGKVFKLALKFIYGNNIHFIEEVVQGSDYGVFLEEIGKKEFYYEDENLLILPALMPFKILDVNEKLTNLIYEGTPFDPGLPGPFNYSILHNKNIKAVYSINDVTKFEGYLYYDNSGSDKKKGTLEFNVAPRTEILKEKNFTSISPTAYMSVKELVLAMLLPVYPELVVGDITILNNFGYRGWLWNGSAYVWISDITFDELYIDTFEFFSGTDTLYQSLTELAACFFSQIFLDKTVVFKQQNIPYPVEDIIPLVNDVNLRNIKKEFRYKHLDFVKINNKTDGAGPFIPQSYTVGDPNGLGYERTIYYTYPGAESHNHILNAWSNIYAFRGSDAYYINYINNIGENIWRKWSLHIAYQYWYFKNSAQNSLLYNLEMVTTETSIAKGYSHNGVNYSPVSLSVDTVKEEGEAKCIKTLPDTDTFSESGLFSAEGYLLHDSNNELIEEYPE